MHIYWGSFHATETAPTFFVYVFSCVSGEFFWVIEEINTKGGVHLVRVCILVSFVNNSMHIGNHSVIENHIYFCFIGQESNSISFMHDKSTSLFVTLW